MEQSEAEQLASALSPELLAAVARAEAERGRAAPAVAVARGLQKNFPSLRSRAPTLAG